MVSDRSAPEAQWIRDPNTLAIRYRPWTEQGVEHRFCGKQFTAPASGEPIRYLKQVHGSTVIRVSEAGPPELHREHTGDAWVVSRGVKTSEAFGLRTADCLPIMIRSKGSYALIHAGWRGLAARVISEALKGIPDRDSGIEVVIGPAAGRGRYEVGGEVIRAVGETAVTVESGAARPLLDLAATALREIRREVRGDMSFAVAPVCTIEDADFHSYRREGALAGRNCSWLMPPGDG